MILNRLGTKKKVAKTIQAHFPKHQTYIEPFFGAGGMFFNKRKAKHNIVNDLDNEVFNLFMVVMHQKQELQQAFYNMPVHSYLLDYWKRTEETKPILKALRFLFLSNFTLYGKMDTLMIKTRANHKYRFESKLNATHHLLNGVQFLNKDFRKFFKSISIETNQNKELIFIYNDPPYVDTTDTYSNSFTIQDTADLIECNLAIGCKFAISEFYSPEIVAIAKKYGLEIIIIGDRQNIKNRRTEILMVNYKSPALYGLFGYQNTSKSLTH